MRTISTEGFEPRKGAEIGPAPMLQWIKIADLVVDPSYQRPILGEGRRNVERIARNFRWSYFAPVVVSPVEGGQFAIIDGQHRTTAAALVGIETVPCQVVVAARDEQAAAFKAINGATTAISRMALHAAALVAGEARAVEVADVCAAAGVELLRYPVPLDRQAPGQTMAVGAIEASLRRYGRETLEMALRCIVASQEGGALTGRMIKAVCELLHDDPSWRADRNALLRAFEGSDLSGAERRADIVAAERRMGRVPALVSELRGLLSGLFLLEAAE